MGGQRSVTASEHRMLAASNARVKATRRGIAESDHNVTVRADLASC